MDFHTETNPGGGREPDEESSAGSGPGTEFTLSDPVDSFVSAVRNVLLNPRNFFQGIDRQGNFVEPLVFALICSAIGGILSGIIGFLVTLVGEGIGAAFLALIGSIFLTPIFAAIGLFVGAGIWHVLVMLLVRPSNAGFEATFRVAAYISVIQLITWIAAIPIVGSIIALLAVIYGLYIAYFGIQEVHSTTRQRAAAVVAIPALVVIVLAIVFWIILAASLS